MQGEPFGNLHSDELERAVLGIMMIGGAVAERGVSVLSPEVFYRGRHRKIFFAIASLVERGEPVDINIVAEELKRRGELKECGGEFYLSDVAASAGTSVNLDGYADILIDLHRRRKVIAFADQLKIAVLDGTQDISDILKSLENKLFGIAGRDGDSSLVLADVVRAAYGQIEGSAASRGVSGVPSGFYPLDDVIGGFQPGQFVLIAARPRMGKTAFAIDVARRAALKGYPVLIFSMEMTAKSLARRLLAQHARVDIRSLQRGEADESEWKRMQEAVNQLERLPVIIDETSALTTIEMKARARAAVRNYKVKLVIVDYLQLMRPSAKADTLYQAVSLVSQELKALAKDIGVPVIACSQMSRGIEQRANKYPMLSDLRESGTLEQDADIVIFLWRPECFGIDADPETGESLKGKAKLIIAKHREGPEGEVSLVWRGEWCRFDVLADAEVLDSVQQYDEIPF